MKTKTFNFVFIIFFVLWIVFTMVTVCEIVDCRAAHEPVNPVLTWVWILSFIAGFIASLITGNMERPQRDEFEDRDDPYSIAIAHNSTCKSCKDWWCCSYVGDLYNINGDCIDEK